MIRRCFSKWKHCKNDGKATEAVGRERWCRECNRLAIGKKFRRTAYEDKEPSSWWGVELNEELQNIQLSSLEQRGEIVLCVRVVSSCSSHSECVLLCVSYSCALHVNPLQRDLEWLTSSQKTLDVCSPGQGCWGEVSFLGLEWSCCLWFFSV